MLRRCFLVRHNMRDKGANSHNSSFDTFSNIYRDAVKPNESQLPKPGESLRDLPLDGAPAVSKRVPVPITREKPPKEKKPAPMSFSGKHPLPRRSGQQQEVLNLYKSLLSAAQEKEHPQTVANLKSQIRAEFRQEMVLERKHITKIEWLVHRGRNKLDEIKAMTNTSRFTVFGG